LPRSRDSRTVAACTATVEARAPPGPSLSSFCAIAWVADGGAGKNGGVESVRTEDDRR